MADNPNAFKHGLGPDAVRRLARGVKRVQPSFPDSAFRRTATRGLEALELKARVAHVVEALRSHLPTDVPEAIDVVVRAGGAWRQSDDDASDPTSPLSSFAAWPLISFVGVHGLDEFDVSMEALRRLTGLFSAEFAVRGFIERDPSRALRLLAGWTQDPDHHVRRLVSEGTRPRLPWGRRLTQFQADPLPVVELLERLKDDDAEYVRRSVANNLNDIAKDHSDVVIDVCRRWTREASTERQWIIRRATRTLVKDGHPDALKLLGFNPCAKVAVENLALEPKAIRLGEQVTFSFDVRSLSRRSQPLLIDYAVHHVKRAGHRTAKVFKLKTLELPSQGMVSITRKHALRRITTRTYYPGRHTIEILINGTSHGVADFDLAP